MIQKLFLIVGMAFFALGFGLFIVGPSADTSWTIATMTPSSFQRILLACMLCIGAIHLLFVGLRALGGEFIVLIALCEAVMGFSLAISPLPFSEHNSAGVALLFLGLMLMANGLTMIMTDGRHAWTIRHVVE